MKIFNQGGAFMNTTLVLHDTYSSVVQNYWDWVQEMTVAA